MQYQLVLSDRERAELQRILKTMRRLRAESETPTAYHRLVEKVERASPVVKEAAPHA